MRPQESPEANTPRRSARPSHDGQGAKERKTMKRMLINATQAEELRVAISYNFV